MDLDKPREEQIEAGAQALMEAFPTLLDDSSPPSGSARSPGSFWRPPMNSEPTEMAGVAEAETQAAYAWALDDGVDDLPTQRLTPRRITALTLAASLIAIAVAGGVALGVNPAHESAVADPAAVFDGTYRFDFNPTNNTVMGSPNPPSKDHPDSNPTTAWRAFRSTCTPAGCTATETKLDDATHAKMPLSTHQWRFTNGRWEMLPVRDRQTVERCKVSEDKTVDGDETVSYTISLEPQPNGSLRGLSTATVISSECGEEGSVEQFPFIAVRVADVASGVVTDDPSTVSAQPDMPAAPVPGPVLDGTYLLDRESGDSHWFAFRSMCTIAGCVATVAGLDDANHQEPTGWAGIFHFIGGHWVDNMEKKRVPCAITSPGATDEQTVSMTWDLVPQPDGTLRGVNTVTFSSNECGSKGRIITTPIVGTRTGPVPPNVVLADPALFV